MTTDKSAAPQTHDKSIDEKKEMTAPIEKQSKLDPNYDARDFDEIGIDEKLSALSEENAKFDPNYDARDFEEIVAGTNEAPSSKAVAPKLKDVSLEKNRERAFDRDSLKAAGTMGSFGLYLLIAVVISYFIGQFIDNFFNFSYMFLNFEFLWCR